MKLVLTVMVRDEVDVIAPMIEHHLAQGVDLIIATDNASVDGTAEVLQAYADLGAVELHHDPVHRKQQHAVVTGMARRARTEHAADWVINADADEFWAPVDKELTLRAALECIPLSLNAFQVPVVNLVGPPAIRGSGFNRLLWRDRRTEEQLQAIGIHAHPTDNVVHRGEADIEVAQGNHFVSLQSNGQPEPAFSLEVYHLPWRSWSQFELKVLNAGRAYEANPELRPSKNHHGMADYRRHRGGRLFPIYMLRHPLPEDIEEGEREDLLIQDTWLREHLEALMDKALRPDLLAQALDTQDDEPIDPQTHRELVQLGRKFMIVELERSEALQLAEQNHQKARRLAAQRDKARAQRDQARMQLRRERKKAQQRLSPGRAALQRLRRRILNAPRGLRRRSRRAYRLLRRRFLQQRSNA